MKKISMLLVTLICAFAVGCTNNKVETAKSLKDAYFDIAKKIENKEEIKVEYVSDLLNGYEYEKGETMKDENSNIEYEMYRFSNNNEELILSDCTYDGEKGIELFYLVNNGVESASMSYTPSNESQGLYINVGVNDIEIYEEISNIIDNNESNLLKIYNEISKNLATTNDITVDKVEQMTNIEPTKEDTLDATTSKEITYYSFTDGSDVMGVYCFKDKENISRISFGSNGEKLFSKGAFGKNYFEGREDILLDININADSISIQEEILNIVFK